MSLLGLVLGLIACTGASRERPSATDTGGTQDSAETADTGAPPDTGDTADTAPLVDADGDGYSTVDDCDDSDPAIYPGALEVSETDGVDADCDGYDSWSSGGWGMGYSVQVVPDLDGDGWMDFLSVFYSWDYHYFKGYLESPSSLPDPEDWLQGWGHSVDAWPPEVLYVGSGSPVGDLDDDGAAELVFACGEVPHTQDASLCLFDGTTLFAAADERSFPRATLGEMPGLLEPVRLLGDLDGDGTDELAVGHSPARVFSTTTLLDADFSLDAAPVAVELEFDLEEVGALDDSLLAINFGIEQADVDGDGLPELFTGSRLYWGADLAEPGAYTSTEAMHAASLLGASGCTSGNAGDLSGDGRADLFVLCQEEGEYGTVRFAEYAADAGAPVLLPGQVLGGVVYEVGPVVGTAGDADDDGFGDVVVGTREPAVDLPYGDPRFPNGAFVVPGALLAGMVDLDGTHRYLKGAAPDVALCDLDGDGFDDLMLGATVVPYRYILP